MSSRFGLLGLLAGVIRRRPGALLRRGVLSRIGGACLLICWWRSPLPRRRIVRRFAGVGFKLRRLVSGWGFVGVGHA